MEEGGDPLQEKEGRPSVYYDVMPYQGELPQDIPETLAEVFEEDTDPAHPTCKLSGYLDQLQLACSLSIRMCCVVEVKQFSAVVSWNNSAHHH